MIILRKTTCIHKFLIYLYLLFIFNSTGIVIIKKYIAKILRCLSKTKDSGKMKNKYLILL